MAGRPPKPVEMRIADGDTRKIGRKKLAESVALVPKPDRGLPECPDHLTGLAREVWSGWADQIAVMNMDYRCDAVMLEGACVAYARAVQADKVLDELGFTTGDGFKRPELVISRDCWAQVKAFCVEFGFTPVSRTRLKVEKPEKTEDLFDLLDKPRAVRNEMPKDRVQ